MATFFAPHLYLKAVADGIAFYQAAFGAFERRRWSNPDGSVHVAEMAISRRALSPPRGACRGRAAEPADARGDVGPGRPVRRRPGSAVCVRRGCRRARGEPDAGLRLRLPARCRRRSLRPSMAPSEGYPFAPPGRPDLVAPGLCSCVRPLSRRRVIGSGTAGGAVASRGAAIGLIRATMRPPSGASVQTTAMREGARKVRCR